MPIRFFCEACEARVKVPEGSEGRKMKCPRCSTVQRVPTDPAKHVEAGALPPSQQKEGEKNKSSDSAEAVIQEAPTGSPEPSPEMAGAGEAAEEEIFEVADDEEEGAEALEEDLAELVAAAGDPEDDGEADDVPSPAGLVVEEAPEAPAESPEKARPGSPVNEAPEPEQALQPIAPEGEDEEEAEDLDPILRMQQETEKAPEPESEPEPEPEPEPERDEEEDTATALQAAAAGERSQAAAPAPTPSPAPSPAPSPKGRRGRVPGYTALFLLSWLFRIVAVFQVVGAIVLVAMSADQEAITMEQRVAGVGAGIFFALIWWGLGELMAAVRDAARNSYRH